MLPFTILSTKNPARITTIILHAKENIMRARITGISVLKSIAKPLAPYLESALVKTNYRILERGNCTNIKYDTANLPKA